jgi:hypothetical protein
MPDIEWKRQTLLQEPRSRWRDALYRVLWHGDELHVILFRKWWLRLW